MKVSTFACDNCGKRRSSDTNHWFVLGTMFASVVITPWDKAILDAGPHACGQECAVSMMSRYLATGSFERSVVSMGLNTIKAGR